MTIRVGVNGLGRIGRNLWTIVHSGAPDIEIVAVNDTAGPATVTHLLHHSSAARAPFPGEVTATGDAIVVDGRRVPVLQQPCPARIPWGKFGVDLVVEATGQFTRADAARGHLRGGARRVVISTASPDADVSLMMGINETAYDPARHRVVSNSCCTTYCLGLLVHALRHSHGVRDGSATVAYAHGGRPGRLLDGVFPQLRMARANATTMAPTSVPGVRHAFDKVLPDLAGKLTATAVRVPVNATSAASLTLRLPHPASAAEVNHALATTAASLLKGYLEVSADPLVSSDVIGSSASCVVDAGLTTALGDLVRVVGWYDNEWGYAHRLVDLIRFVAHHG